MRIHTQTHTHTHTSAAGLVQGCSSVGGESRVDLSSMLQQQTHTHQAASCTRVTQSRTAMDVPHFHLSHTHRFTLMFSFLHSVYTSTICIQCCYYITKYISRFCDMKDMFVSCIQCDVLGDRDLTPLISPARQPVAADVRSLSSHTSTHREEAWCCPPSRC